MEGCHWKLFPAFSPGPTNSPCSVCCDVEQGRWSEAMGPHTCVMIWKWGKTIFLCTGNQHHVCLHKVGEQLKDSVCFWCRFPHYLFIYLWQMMAWSLFKALLQRSHGCARRASQRRGGGVLVRRCGERFWVCCIDLGKILWPEKLFWTAWQQSNRAGEVLPLFLEFRGLMDFHCLVAA